MTAAFNKLRGTIKHELSYKYDRTNMAKHRDTVKQTTIPSIADILTWRNICIHTQISVVKITTDT